MIKHHLGPQLRVCIVQVPLFLSVHINSFTAFTTKRSIYSYIVLWIGLTVKVKGANIQALL